MNAAKGVTLSAAAAAFDRIAGTYDAQFTHTTIGRAQRKQVWTALLSAFPEGSRVLELNCGTGEDARFLAKQGRFVVACDASAEMLQVARRRNWIEGQVANIEYLRLANEDLDCLRVEARFDGAFSNFSGLNCVQELAPVARSLANFVKPGGRVLVCFWSRTCLAEILWYLLRGQPKKAVRRFRREAIARLGGLTISVNYHTLGEVRRAFSPWFALKSRRAIGLFVPPSYTEESMSRHEKMLSVFEWVDRVCSDLPVLRDIGDHILLEFVRCSL
jgi:ubiquinone/menaquinone biosynthesis C-methylase UbiE